MQKVTFSIVVLLFFHICLSAQDFEGVIVMTKSENNTEKSTTFTVKGDMVLVQMETKNGPVKIINNRKDGVTTSLFTKNDKKYAYISRESEQKAYPLDDRQRMIMDMAKKQLSLEVTAETRNIKGHSCTKILGQNHEEHVEAWVTDDIQLSLFELFPNKQSKESEDLDLQKMIWDKGFVMEYWTKNKADGVVSKISFNPIEKNDIRQRI